MKTLLQILVLLVITNTTAQNYNIPYRKGKLWGFADKTGKITLQPKYDSIDSKMANFRWFVYKDNKIGVINTEGQERIAVEYDSISRNPVHSRYNEFYVYKQGKSGYADLHGKFILPVNYYRISKLDDEKYGATPLKFAVKDEATSNWKMIDESQKEVLANIESFKNLHDGYYQFQVNNQWGIYNILTQKWILNPEYESINYFDYKDFHKPKEAYKDVKYYAIKNNTFYLITKSFEVKPHPNKKLEDFFEKPNMSAYPATQTAYIEDSIVSDENIKAVTGNNYTENKAYKTENFRRTRLQISIIKIKNKYELKTNSILFDENQKPILFDEIRLFKNNYDDEYKSTIALVRTNKNWAIFNIKENKLLASYTFNSFEFHKKYSNFLMLKSKNKIGLYDLEDNRNKETATVIEPIYDSFTKIEYIQSLDYNYDSFNLYYFMKNGKICPVGINGVKFYED